MKKNKFLALLSSLPHAKTPRNKKNKGELRKLIFIFLLIFGIWALLDSSLWYRVVSFFEYPFHYKEYREFGIRVPTKYEIHGIDVSRYQSKIDWQRVRKMKVGSIKIQFVFIKATEGTWLTDKYFERNWATARAAGLTCGAYHFFRPKYSARDQAFHFMKTVKLRAGDLPPVIDIETEDGMTREQIRKNTKIFLDLLAKKYKTKPILYTNRDFYKNYFSGQPDFDGYLFWIAHYHVTDLSLPDGRTWHFWQHSDKGQINGINEPVDFNVFSGDSLALRRICLP